jgi:Mu transposase, C-terminal
VSAYNTRRIHTELGDQTPLERWRADATPLRIVPEEDLRFLLLPGQERAIQKHGIHFGGVAFISPELNGRVGQHVQVRAMPHDLRRIEVFVGGRWLTTAYPQATLSAGRYYPLYEEAPADLVLFIDEYFGHGNFRNWAAFTRSAQELVRETRHERIDEAIARNVFALHGGGVAAR